MSGISAGRRANQRAWEGLWFSHWSETIPQQVIANGGQQYASHLHIALVTKTHFIGGALSALEKRFMTMQPTLSLFPSVQYFCLKAFRNLSKKNCSA